MEGTEGCSEKPKQEKSAPKVHVLDSHQRVNFLHQAALQISSNSTEVDDGYAKLSRAIGKHFREVLNTERVKVEADIMRTFCKKCKQVLFAKSKRFDLKMMQKKVMQRKCLHCGHTKNYQLNPGHLSRNEKFKKSQMT